MKGRKSLSAIIFLIVFGFYCYGENDFKILKSPKIEFQTSFTMPIKQSLRNESPAVTNKIKFDFYSINTDASVYLTVNSTDTVLSVMTIPVSYKLFQLGVGFKYHLYHYFNIFYENDFLFNQFFAFLYKDIIRLQINTGYDLKLTEFKNPIINPVFYQTILLGMDFIWNINKYIQVFVGVNSMSDYDFSLIGTPIYNLGANFKIKDKLSIGVNYETKMIDMVAVAETVSEMLLTVNMKVLF